jgi:hypothetical protein
MKLRTWTWGATSESREVVLWMKRWTLRISLHRKEKRP